MNCDSCQKPIDTAADPDSEIQLGVLKLNLCRACREYSQEWRDAFNKRHAEGDNRV